MFPARLGVLEFSATAAQHYGNIRAEPERTETPLGIHDLLSGAHAAARI
jgi:tRNA(fMet)-specific endonuclease VapC